MIRQTKQEDQNELLYRRPSFNLLRAVTAHHVTKPLRPPLFLSTKAFVNLAVSIYSFWRMIMPSNIEHLMLERGEDVNLSVFLHAGKISIHVVFLPLHDIGGWGLQSLDNEVAEQAQFLGPSIMQNFGV